MTSKWAYSTLGTGGFVLDIVQASNPTLSHEESKLFEVAFLSAFGFGGFSSIVTTVEKACGSF